MMGPVFEYIVDLSYDCVFYLDSSSSSFLSYFLFLFGKMMIIVSLYFLFFFAICFRLMYIQ